MSNGNLPKWNASGILPPVQPEKLGNSRERSPYRTGLIDFIDQFSISPERLKILRGLLRFREKLHSFGIVSGFQWLNGSFLENVEEIESCPPRDIDIVTFFYPPDGEDENSLVQKEKQLFDNNHLKKNYAVDGYFIRLGQPTDTRTVRLISYWYSLWSHRRNDIWKGFVELTLNPFQDVHARSIINKDGGSNRE